LTQDADNNVSFNFGNAFMYAGSLLSILLAHEMGHYLVGRWRGVQTSLPYFIPMPFVLSGTMGAVIVQREPFEDRRTLLEVGLAGPLAGFVLAVPLLIIGLALSEVKDIPADTSSIIIFGDSILTKVVGQFFHGPINPASGRDIFLHPIGLGAWFGLLITGINLIPAGQLDGGHIAYALLGNKAKWVSYAMIAALGVLYFLGSEGWLLWVFLLFVFGRNHPPVLNQASRITPAHLMLALIGVVVFVLTFVPYPVYGL
jgi:membrane-associated protease RseP (regulator of RpoE activity)